MANYPRHEANRRLREVALAVGKHPILSRKITAEHEMSREKTANGWDSTQGFFDHQNGMTLTVACSLSTLSFWVKKSSPAGSAKLGFATSVAEVVAILEKAVLPPSGEAVCRAAVLEVRQLR